MTQHDNRPQGQGDNMPITCPYLRDKLFQEALEALEELEADYPDLEDQLDQLLDEQQE